jgi:hypothetical protein
MAHETLLNDKKSLLNFFMVVDIISSDIMKLIQGIYYNLLDVSKINFIMICLIPEKSHAKLITQFRPITYQSYKLYFQNNY